jgi:uncharacterized Zn finger protein (UPF0148 family)
MKTCKSCNNNSFIINDDGTILCAYCHAELLIEKPEDKDKPQSKSKAVKK